MVRHAWQITVREFVERVQKDYGIGIGESHAGIVVSRFLRQGVRDLVLLIDEDEILSPSVLRSLCRFYRLDPLDFALDPEDEED